MNISNAQIGALLDEIAMHLQLRGANPFRVAAYRNAAVTLRNLKRPLNDILRHEGLAGLERLPGVGTSLAKKIAEVIRRGRLRQLERLRRQGPDDVLATLPSVGQRLAGRIRATLGIDSLDELSRAARDGRLRRVAGMGRKRVQAIQESLATRLEHPPSERIDTPRQDAPSVRDLLAIDREYRRQAARGRLLRVSPRRFNPTRAAWLPVLRTERGGHRYCAHYTNSARSHESGHVYDWVAIFREDKEAFGQWTVVTATHGPLRGRRIVRGRERECQEHYQRTLPVQLRLPSVD
jgi:putative hydrolase